MMFDAHAYQGQPSFPLPQLAPQGLVNFPVTPYQTHGQIYPGASPFFGQLGGAMGQFGSPMTPSFGPYPGFGSPYGQFGVPPIPWTQLGSLHAQCAHGFGAQHPAQQALGLGGLNPLQQQIPFGGFSPQQQQIPFGGLSPLQQQIPFGGFSPFQQSLPFGGLSQLQHSGLFGGLGSPAALQHGQPFGAFGSLNPYGHQQPFGGWPGQPIACLTPQGLVAILPTQSPQQFGTPGFWPSQQQLGRISPYQLTPQMA